MYPRRELLMAALAGAGLSLTAPSHAQGNPNKPAKPPVFAVEFTTGPGWDAGKAPNEQRHFADHSANLRRLRDTGALLFGARYSDKGLIVLEAADEAAARAEIERDPSVAAGTFRYALFPMHAFYPGCVGLG